MEKDPRAGGAGDGRSRESGTLQTLRRPLSFPHDRDFRILSLDGGGIKGIFTAAFLARVEREFLNGESIGRHFDLVAGTSTGGLIALCLAAGKTAQDALKLYLENGAAIFDPVSWRLLKAGFDTAPLHNAANDVLGDRVLSDASVRLCIPAVNARKAEPCMFKTPHHPDYKFDAGERMIDVALATTAAPTFFQPHETSNYVLLDGGLIANNPVMVAVVDALSCFDIARRQVSILSIGTGSPQPIITEEQMSGGRKAWSTIHDSFIYYADKNATGQAGLLIGRDRMIRVAPEGDDALIDMTDAASAIERLPVAAEAAVTACAGRIAAMLSTRAERPSFYHGPHAVSPIWSDAPS
ncbi:MAG: patatin-like phospholipase family protein [Hyphomonadaceae bacterium]|nr:patatin-like phospholipase family protein [Hyphomonadaceae bacterium]